MVIVDILVSYSMFNVFRGATDITEMFKQLQKIKKSPQQKQFAI